MIYCRNCGVELDEHMNFCPLCGVPVLKNNSAQEEKLIWEKQEGTKKLQHELDLLNRTQKIKFYWEVVSILLASGILSALVLDLVISNTFTWSVYVLIGGGTIFLYATVFSFVKSELSIVVAVFIISALSLLILDLVHNSISWSVQLGLPLLVAVCIILILVFEVIKYAREKGFNIIAYILLALAILSIAVEGILSLYLFNVFELNWSAIVFFSTLPGAAMLLYIHFKLRKGTDLRRFFHI